LGQDDPNQGGYPKPPTFSQPPMLLEEETVYFGALDEGVAPWVSAILFAGRTSVRVRAPKTLLAFGLVSQGTPLVGSPRLT
jgi:hypothetical protein